MTREDELVVPLRSAKSLRKDLNERRTFVEEESKRTLSGVDNDDDSEPRRVLFKFSDIFS